MYEPSRIGKTKQLPEKKPTAFQKCTSLEGLESGAAADSSSWPEETSNTSESQIISAKPFVRTGVKAEVPHYMSGQV
jgi:hypothetical protein